MSEALQDRYTPPAAQPAGNDELSEAIKGVYNPIVDSALQDLIEVSCQPAEYDDMQTGSVLLAHFPVMSPAGGKNLSSDQAAYNTIVDHARKNFLRAALSMADGRLDAETVVLATNPEEPEHRVSTIAQFGSRTLIERQFYDYSGQVSGRTYEAVADVDLPLGLVMPRMLEAVGNR